MLEKIRLTNFKAFKDITFDIKPITIFVGQNNSGKSSFIASLRLLAQSSTSFDGAVPLLLNGPLGDFGTFKDIVNDNSTRKTISIELWFKSWGNEMKFIENFYKKGKIKGIKQTIKFKHKPILRQTVISDFDLEINDKSEITVAYNSKANKHYLKKYQNKTLDNYFQDDSSFEALFHHFHVMSLEPGDNFKNRTELNELRSLRHPIGLQDASISYWKNIEYIGPVRQSPKRSYIYSGERHGKVGKKEKMPQA